MKAELDECSSSSFSRPPSSFMMLRILALQIDQFPALVLEVPAARHPFALRGVRVPVVDARQRLSGVGFTAQRACVNVDRAARTFVDRGRGRLSAQREHGLRREQGQPQRGVGLAQTEKASRVLLEFPGAIPRAPGVAIGGGAAGPVGQGPPRPRTGDAAGLTGRPPPPAAYATNGLAAE